MVDHEPRLEEERIYENDAVCNSLPVLSHRDFHAFLEWGLCYLVQFVRTYRKNLFREENMTDRRTIFKDEAF